MEKKAQESVQEQELERDAPLTPSLPPKKRTVFEKLGPYNSWVLVLGTIVILGCIGFLAFIWTVAINRYTNDTLPPLWKSIVANNWTARVVTLTTVLIRVALAAQLCVFAALIAALIIERVGASHEDFPLLSMIRCANTGPQALLWNVFHTIAKGTQLRYTIVIVAMILNALTLQFMSTILLADFWPSWIVLDHKSLADFKWAIDDGPSQNSTFLANNFWQLSQNTYPSFAEWKGKGSQDVNYTDTGATYRGFLPFTNSTLRENLQSYEGYVTVIDERVVCVKPRISNPKYIGWNTTDDLYTTFSGTLAFNGIHPDISEDPSNLTDFNCRVPFEFMDPTIWQLSLCQLGTGVGMLKGGIASAASVEDDSFDSAKAWLVLNATINDAYNFVDFIPEGAGSVSVPITSQPAPDGAWTKVGQVNVTIDATLCFNKPQVDVYEVSLSNEFTFFNKEVSLLWDPQRQRYDTRALRSLLGGISEREKNESNADAIRDSLSNNLTEIEQEMNYAIMSPGKFEFSEISNWSEHSVVNKYDYSIDSYRSMMELSQFKFGVDPHVSFNQTNVTFALTPSTFGTDQAVHRSLLWLAQDVIRDIGDPAIMLQSLLHVLMQTAYYDLYNNFDLRGNETHFETEIRSIPSSNTFFIVVISLLCFHFLLMIVALVWFLMRTELSLLGNAWQAVAQVASEDTKEAMHHGSMQTDNELRHNAETAHKIRLVKSQNSGRLEAVSVKK